MECGGCEAPRDVQGLRDLDSRVTGSYCEVKFKEFMVTHSVKQRFESGDTGVDDQPGFERASEEEGDELDLLTNCYDLWYAFTQAQATKRTGNKENVCSRAAGATMRMKAATSFKRKASSRAEQIDLTYEPEPGAGAITVYGAAGSQGLLRPALSTAAEGSKRPKDLSHIMHDMLTTLSRDREKQVTRSEAAVLLETRKLALAERQMTMEELKYERELSARNAR